MTHADQAIKAALAYHLEHPQASWNQHAEHLRSIDLGFAVDPESHCCVFADGSATDPDIERAFPSLERAAACDDCLEAQKQGYVGCGGCFGQEIGAGGWPIERGFNDA